MNLLITLQTPTTTYLSTLQQFFHEWHNILVGRMSSHYDRLDDTDEQKQDVRGKMGGA